MERQSSMAESSTFLLAHLVTLCTTVISSIRVPLWQPRAGELFAIDVLVVTSMTSSTSDWTILRDERYGFSFRHPQEWQSTTGASGVRLSSGEIRLPNGVPEVDIFVQVAPVRDEFPKDYLVDKVYRSAEGADVDRGISYTERKEVNVGGLPALRARFRSFGPTPNWGIEYVIRKGHLVLNAYVSQPSPRIQCLFETMMSTLEW
jgi:hypothetical protein